jgi:PDZ domain-containing secreted protein
VVSINGLGVGSAAEMAVVVSALETADTLTIHLTRHNEPVDLQVEVR